MKKPLALALGLAALALTGCPPPSAYLPPPPRIPAPPNPWVAIPEAIRAQQAQPPPPPPPSEPPPPAAPGMPGYVPKPPQ